MRLFSSNSADKWYDNVRRYRESDDPEDQEIGEKMDRCPNNPRYGGPGFYGKDKHLDRR